VNRRIRIALGSRSYPVTITTRGAALVASELVRLDRPWFVVTDRRVASLLWPSIVRALAQRGVVAPAPLFVPSGESAKSLAVLERLAAGLLRRGAGRDAVLVALGGGAVGDLAGFAAATFMRGVEWLAVPTTLLAMVDASIGGKTAVDIERTKNAVGAFHQPRGVLIGTDFLRTLPARERRSGLGEVVKYGMIADHALFAALERAPHTWRHPRPEADARLVARCTRIKARYVAADEHEAGARAALNFGHTLGHVLESTGGWTHGESVALGMLAACDIAVGMQVAPARIRARLQHVLAELGLPTHAPHVPSAAAVRRIIRSDKKGRDGVPRFVLTPRIGAVSVGHRVPEAFVLRALRALRDDHPTPRLGPRAMLFEDDHA